MTACTYCGAEIEAHTPVYVEEGPDRTPAGQFCNYACLQTHIEETGLTTGACCRIDV